MSIIAGQAILASDFSGFQTGIIWPHVLRTVPTNWLACKGQAVSRTTYSALFAVLCPSATVTMTIASPCVVTWSGNVLNNGDQVVFSTTGALPTGLTAGTVYYVVGLSGNTFNVAKTYGGSAINTSGSQSGTQTCQVFTFGVGDGSTTFNVPNISGRLIMGAGQFTKTATILSVSGNVITATGIGGNGNEFQTGEACVFTAGTAGNLTNGATYYVVRVSNTTFSVATSLANAQNGTVITLAGTETGSFAITGSTRVLGDTGGEEVHAMSITELVSHIHPINTGSGTLGSGFYFGGYNNSSGTSNVTIGAQGGNAAMNVLNPFTAMNWMIHI